MTDEQIDALATYFTGPAVVYESIMLGQSAGFAKMAKQFFAAREALGIQGYDQKEEAVRKIKEIVK